MTGEPAFRIICVPAFKDNYIWMLRDDRQAAVIDPGDAQPVLDYLQHENLRLATILVTHHHADHIGGIDGLLGQFRVPVFGPKNEPIPQLTHRLGAGESVSIPELEAQFEVLDIPGHTRGHIAYYGTKLLFCGDTLFSCGCGRVFEGTPQQMYLSLAKLAALPEDTLVHCAHEYTLANIRFARAVDPGNAALAGREERAKLLRAQNQPTVPSTIADEKATNPFLRCKNAALIESASKRAGKHVSGPAEVFAAIRQWKNEF